MHMAFDAADSLLNKCGNNRFRSSAQPTRPGAAKSAVLETTKYSWRRSSIYKWVRRPGKSPC
uniref:Uncharacterized protein n=1 Tax=Utricularia reniformis TaxID=192314 RepID=A0A1Y0B3K2_9LAMI|nr:hypothetical protein AEK19_MT0854 [Utricularia reniformis]YP_009382283.1 hypothetical protein AEK19_MT1855 [Utricularia reniformis]ART31085.1 hypothetical protein AEK19_MT0854 [Utricularia reniformis]ART32026.1 hypothetical protein AEK19_MT1855 [Utricularia reniformis]